MAPRLKLPWLAKNSVPSVHSICVQNGPSVHPSYVQNGPLVHLAYMSRLSRGPILVWTNLVGQKLGPLK